MSDPVSVGGLWTVVEADGLDPIEQCQQSAALAERILSAIGFPGREGWVDAEASGHLQRGSAASLAKQLADRSQRVLAILEVARQSPAAMSIDLVVALAEAAFVAGATRTMLDVYKVEDLGVPAKLLEAGRARKIAQRKGGSNLAKVNRTANGQTFAEAKDELQRIWRSGRYPSKNKCAEGEFERLGISLKTARGALAGIPSGKQAE